MMNNSARDLITLRNVTLMFRNFSGEARKFNNAGDRNFNVILNDEQAKVLSERGYRIRTLPPMKGDPDGEEIKVLKVNVSYKYQEPTVVIISGTDRQNLHEDTVGMLDKAYIQRADLTFRGSPWEMANGDKGVSAYLNSIYVTLDEDPLASEYAENAQSPDDEMPF